MTSRVAIDAALSWPEWPTMKPSVCARPVSINVNRCGRPREKRSNDCSKGQLLTESNRWNKTMKEKKTDNLFFVFHRFLCQLISCFRATVLCCLLLHNHSRTESASSRLTSRRHGVEVRRRRWKKKLVGAGKLMATLINLGGAFTPPPFRPRTFFWWDVESNRSLWATVEFTYFVDWHCSLVLLFEGRSRMRPFGGEMIPRWRVAFIWFISMASTGFEAFLFAKWRLVFLKWVLSGLSVVFLGFTRYGWTEPSGLYQDDHWIERKDELWRRASYRSAVVDVTGQRRDAPSPPIIFPFPLGTSDFLFLRHLSPRVASADHFSIKFDCPNLISICEKKWWPNIVR